MEKIITSGKNIYITTEEVESLLKDTGIIIGYISDNISACVALYNNRYYVNTLDESDDFDSLDELLRAYPKYTFKYFN